MEDLISSSHSKNHLAYHVQWCTKYRHKTLSYERLRLLAEAAILSAAEEGGITIAELSVMPEHVHAVIHIPVSMSVSKALQLLKGGSSYRL